MTALGVQIASLSDRTVARVSGRITAVIVEPAGSPPGLRARIEDASGRLEAVFMGRREIPGIEPGQDIEVEGRVAMTGTLARMYNPRYELT